MSNNHKGRRTTAQSRKRDAEYRIKTKDGRTLDVLQEATFTTDEQGRPFGATVVAHDITERKKAEETLRNAHEDLQVRAEQLQTVIDLLEAKQQEVERANDNLQMQEQDLRQHAEDLQTSRERLALAASGTRLGMYEWNVVTGETLWTEQVARLLGLRTTTTTTTTTTTISLHYHYRDWAERVHPEDLPRVETELYRCMAEQAPYEAEYRVIWTDGSVHWLADRGVFQYESDGQCTRMVGIVWDITERRQGEEALRESEERFRTAFERGPVPMALTALDSTLLKVNACFCRMLGFRQSELVGRSLTELTHPEDRAASLVGTQRLASGTIASFRMKKRYLRKDGAVVWADVSTASVPDAAGRPLYCITHVQDITQRKEAQDARQRSERRERERAEELATLLDAVPTPVIIVHDRDGAHMTGNRAADELLRHPRGTEISLSAPAETRPRHFHAVKDGRELRTEELPAHRAARGEPVRDFEFSLVFDDGTTRHVLGYGTPLRDENGHPRGAVHVLVDVTDRKRAEEALRQSEARYRTVGETIPYGVWLTDGTGYCTYVSDSFLDLVGMTMEQVQRFGWLHLLPPEDVEPTKEHWLRCVATGENFEREHRFRTKEGPYRHVLAIGRPLRNEQGQITSWVGINLDITQRRQAEEALRELNATLEAKVAARTAELEGERRRLYDVLEAIPAMVCLLMPDYHIVFANRSFRARFGEAHGRHCYEFCFGRTEPCEFCETYRVLQTGRPHRWELTGPDGRTIIDAHDFPFADVDGSPLILEMDIDITERKRVEAALRDLNETLSERARQLQKLTLELTQAEERERRRIALLLHEDLLQQIAGARFHLNLLRSSRKPETAQETVARVEEMLNEAIEKSRRLSHDLSPAVLHLNDLQEVLQWLIRRLQAQHGLSVRLDVADVTTVRSEALTTFLFRAAQELLLNVVQHAGVNEAALRVRRRGRYVGLRVSDQGRGFDPQELWKAAGFGLLSIRERVELLGGRMKIKGVRSRGSVFRVVVPNDEKPENKEREIEEASPGSGLPRP